MELISVAELSVQQIESWIINWVAKETKMEKNNINPNESLTNLGLGSRQSFMLVSDIEEWLNRKLSPSLPWDYPSIRALSLYLADTPSN